MDVTLAAICGTDVGEYLHGPVQLPLYERHHASGHLGPIVIGHEFVGVVGAVGEGVTRLAPGDRVACGAGVSCGECRWCAAGRTNLCARYYTLGLSANGGLADRVAAPASACFAIVDTCDDRSAVLAQPLAIALHAVDRAGVGAG